MRALSRPHPPPASCDHPKITPPPWHHKTRHPSQQSARASGSLGLAKILDSSSSSSRSHSCHWRCFSKHKDFLAFYVDVSPIKMLVIFQRSTCHRFGRVVFLGGVYISSWAAFPWKICSSNWIISGGFCTRMAWDAMRRPGDPRSQNGLRLNRKTSGWWCQTIWKILVKLDHFPLISPSRDENKKSLKAPPSH